MIEEIWNYLWTTEPKNKPARLNKKIDANEFLELDDKTVALCMGFLIMLFVFVIFSGTYYPHIVP